MSVFEKTQDVIPAWLSSDIATSLATVPGIRTANLSDMATVMNEKLETYQQTEDNPPRLITSVGGSTETPSVVAPANIITGLEVLKRFTEQDISTTLSVRFATRYAIDANGIDESQATLSSWQTALMYRSFAERFYPAVTPYLNFAVERACAVDSLPQAVLQSAGYYDAASVDSIDLRAQIDWLSQYGKKRNPAITQQQTVRYLLSHTTIFEDVIADPTSSDFVIKIGSPSEMQFSSFQSAVIEQALALGGLQVRLANPTQQRPYNQLSLFGPRIGTRPSYYKQDPIERDILGAPPDISNLSLKLPAQLTKVQRLNKQLPEAYKQQASGNSELQKRYKQFFGLLAAIKISPAAYESWLMTTRQLIEDTTQ